MTLSPATLLVAAWRVFRRDAGLLLPLAGTFVFLPAWAVMLVTDPVPAFPETRDQAAMTAWAQAVTAWGQANAGWYVAADMIGLFGAAAIAMLLVAPSRPTVGEALAQAARRFLPFAGLSLLAAIPVGIGLWLFVLPGLYAQARLAVAMPLLAADPATGVAQAIRGSMVRTRGRGLAITGALVMAFLARWIVAMPLLSADEWLRGPGNENPLVLTLVDAGLAAGGAAWTLAALLVGVIAYRASRGT